MSSKDYTMIDNVGLLLGMFVTIMFSARISGSHFNPCITFSFMVGNVKHGNFDRILGFLYIAAQFAGGMLGAIFSKIFASGKDDNINFELKGHFQQLVLEMMGSFFLVFMYLSSTDKKTKFTSDAAIQTIILAGSYLGAMLLAGSQLPTSASPVNPALAFSVILWNPTVSNWAAAWILCGASFAGSFLALIFFRFVYQKTTETLEQMEEEEQEGHNNEALLG